MSTFGVSRPDELAPVAVPLRAPRRWNAGVIASALVALTCALGLLSVVNGYAATQDYLVFTRDLPDGAVLTPGDLRTEQGKLAPSTSAAIVPGAERQTIIGRRLTAPAFSGAPLVHGQVVENEQLRPGFVAISIPVKPENAVGGQLRQGSTVRVLATQNKGKPESRTVVLVEAATVQAVGRERRLGTSSPGGAADPAAADGLIMWLTLLLDEATALELSRARWNADLDIVLLPARPAQSASAATPRP